MIHDRVTRAKHERNKSAMHVLILAANEYTQQKDEDQLRMSTTMLLNSDGQVRVNDGRLWNHEQSCQLQRPQGAGNSPVYRCRRFSSEQVPANREPIVGSLWQGKKNNK